MDEMLFVEPPAAANCCQLRAICCPVVVHGVCYWCVLSVVQFFFAVNANPENSYWRALQNQVFVLPAKNNNKLHDCPIFYRIRV